jgi:hypothetical protein
LQVAFVMSGRLREIKELTQYRSRAFRKKGGVSSQRGWAIESRLSVQSAFLETKYGVRSIQVCSLVLSSVSSAKVIWNVTQHRGGGVRGSIHSQMPGRAQGSLGYLSTCTEYSCPAVSPPSFQQSLPNGNFRSFHQLGLILYSVP